MSIETQAGLFGGPSKRNSAYHNTRGDKFMHVSNRLKDTAAQKTEMAQQDGVGFFKRHSLMRQAAKSTKQANKLANKALFHWNKADKYQVKENGISRPPKGNSLFSTHIRNPDSQYRSGVGGDEFGADDHVYKPVQNRLPRPSTPPNTHMENPTPHAPPMPHPPRPNNDVVTPYENHNHFEHRNQSGGNQHHTNFEAQQQRQFNRAQQLTHTPHDDSTPVTASEEGGDAGGTIGWESAEALGGGEDHNDAA